MAKTAPTASIPHTIGAALVDRVRQTQAVYVVERGGLPVAEISPVRVARCTLGELATLLATLSPAGEAFLKEVEAGIERYNRPAVPGERWER
jgi:predicted regulator of Ras-like GTPase activity (Roadblock/LC7/MglB family)